MLTCQLSRWEKELGSLSLRERKYVVVLGEIKWHNSDIRLNTYTHQRNLDLRTLVGGYRAPAISGLVNFAFRLK